MNGVVGVIMMVGVAVSLSAGLGAVAMQDLEDVNDGVDVVAGQHAYDVDGDGFRDGDLFWVVHKDDPGRVALVVLVNGTEVARTHAEHRRGGVSVPCADQALTVGTLALQGDHRGSAGTFTVKPCPSGPAGAGGGTGDLAGRCFSTSGETQTDSCAAETSPESGCKLLGLETVCIDADQS